MYGWKAIPVGKCQNRAKSNTRETSRLLFVILIIRFTFSFSTVLSPLAHSISQLYQVDCFHTEKVISLYQIDIRRVPRLGFDLPYTVTGRVV
jgi:hypothetical protein